MMLFGVGGNAHVFIESFVQTIANNKIKQNYKTEKEIAYICMYKNDSVFIKFLTVINSWLYNLVKLLIKFCT